MAMVLAETKGTAQMAMEMAEWKIAHIRAANKHGEFRKGDLAPFLREISTTYDVPYATVQNFHYRNYMVGKAAGFELNEQQSEAESIELNAAAGSAAEEMDQDRLENKIIAESGPIEQAPRQGAYKPGCNTEVKVVDVRKYGAIVETIDGSFTRGLIHITKIRKNEFVPDVQKFLRVGDVVKALILEFDTQQNRLQLSTQPFPMEAQAYFTAATEALKPQVEEPATTIETLAQGEEPINPMADKLIAFKDKILTFPNPPAMEAAKVEKIEVIPPVPTSSASAKQIDDLAQVKIYLKRIIGTMTPAAEEMLNNTVSEAGMFRFTMAMTKVIENFQADLGVHLMKEIEAQLGECL